MAHTEEQVRTVKAAIEGILKANNIGLFGDNIGRVVMVNAYGDELAKLQNPKVQSQMTEEEKKAFQKDGEDILNEGPE